MQLDRIEGNPDEKSPGAAMSPRRCSAASASPMSASTPARAIAAARQHRQPSRQRAAGHPVVCTRTIRWRSRMAMPRPPASPWPASAQQCRAAARHDEPVQRLVRPRADDRARGDRPARCREAPSLDRLDPHLARSRRLHPLDHQVGRPAVIAAGAGESMCRAHIATRTAPTAPVYICLDAGLRNPGSTSRRSGRTCHASRRRAAAPGKGRRRTRRRTARACRAAGDHVRARIAPARVLAAARAPRGGARCLRGERSQAGAVFPTDHPAHHLPPFNVLPKPARELLCEADVILALDWVDLGGALRQAKSGKVAAKIVAATLDQNLHTGANMEYQALAAVDVAMAATGDAVVEDLLAVLGSDRRREPWKARVPAKIKTSDGPGIRMEQIAATLRAEFNDPENVTSARSVAAGLSTSGRSRTVSPISARTAAAAWAPDQGSRSGRRWRCTVSAAIRSRCSGTAISAWARPRSGPRCATASRCSCSSTTTARISMTSCTRTPWRARAGATSPTAGSDCAWRIRAGYRQARRSARRRRRRSGPHRRRGRGGDLARVAVLKSGGVCVIDFHVDPPPKRSDRSAPCDRRLTRAALVTPRDR